MHHANDSWVTKKTLNYIKLELFHLLVEIVSGICCTKYDHSFISFKSKEFEYILEQYDITEQQTWLIWAFIYNIYDLHYKLEQEILEYSWEANSPIHFSEELIYSLVGIWMHLWGCSFSSHRVNLINENHTGSLGFRHLYVKQYEKFTSAYIQNEIISAFRVTLHKIIKFMCMSMRHQQAAIEICVKEHSDDKISEW